MRSSVFLNEVPWYSPTLLCWAVPRYYHGSAVLLFHGTSAVEVTVLLWHCNTTNTAVLPYGTCRLTPSTDSIDFGVYSPPKLCEWKNGTRVTMLTRNKSGDKTANLNFLYDDISYTINVLADFGEYYSNYQKYILLFIFF